MLRGVAVATVCVAGLGSLGEAPVALAQPTRVQPGQIERSMPDFSLPALKGPTVTLSRLRGHTVILVFPRGKVADEDGSDPRWCQLCHYQYAELAALERKTSFRAAQNIEVLFVLPYSGEDVAEWVAILPTQVATIDRWREQVPAWRDRLPGKIVFTGDPGALPFPILYDADRAVSKRLGLLTLAWDRAAVEQNVPTVFVVDSNGVIRFKYTSQNTFDRPSASYLIEVVRHLIG
jgi:peroxiredoxin